MEKKERTEAQLKALEAGRKKMAEIRAAKKAAVETEVEEVQAPEEEPKVVRVKAPKKKKKRVIVIEESSSSEEEIVVKSRRREGRREAPEPERRPEPRYPWTGRERMWNDMFRM